MTLPLTTAIAKLNAHFGSKGSGYLRPKKFIFFGVPEQIASHSTMPLHFDASQASRSSW